MKFFTLTDEFDGRTLQHLRRCSTRRLARKLAEKFAQQTTEPFCLIEQIGRQRNLVEIYHPSTREQQ